MNAGKIVRISIIALLVLVLGFGIVKANEKTPNSEKVWDEQTTVGSMDAENYFVIYTDLMCPYCIAFENAILENEEEFNQYIADNDILIDVKLSEFLYDYGESKPINSRYSAEAAYCAKKEDKFWDYYSHAVKTIWNSYFKGTGKSGFMQLNTVNKEYWINLGEQVGLGESFRSCVENDETLDEVIKNTEKTAKSISGGMPFFKFNKYEVSGFDLSWGWDYVKAYFEKGLANK